MVEARGAESANSEPLPMKSNAARGKDGERDVIRKIRCPNCGKRLMALPTGFPLYDLQCTGCVFRAQVKTNNSKPKDIIFGAGFAVLGHALRTGQLIPPLIANFRWREGRKRKQLIILYPFLSLHHIRKRVLSKRSRHAGYVMFNYVGLLDENTPRTTLLTR